MKNQNLFLQNAKLGLLLLGSAVALGACSPRAPQTIMLEPSGLGQGVAVTRQAPGTVEYVWEEPMVDVVDVPPGLDPEGHYYRPAHQEVVEIRQGRWKYYRYPTDSQE